MVPDRRPPGLRPGAGAVFKRVFVGRPIPTEHAHHQRLPKVVALPVFASDALSSTAYATEEMLKVLLPVAGLAAFRFVTPLSGVIVALLAILIASYRQTIKAYPSAGGAYIVTRDNFGIIPAQVAGVSLLTDYILTVAVSIAAGVSAMVAAAPGLHNHRVLIALFFLVLLTLANLRGVKESGVVFAVPTYVFIGAMFTLLGIGAFRFATGGLQALPFDPSAAATSHGAATAGGLTVFLVLHAFSSGCTAMTGVEAVSNGVPAFRPPEWRNAIATLTVMGGLLGVMFIGLSLLTTRLHATPTETSTLVAEIAKAVFGGGGIGRAGFLLVQLSTMAILILAANTAYADFPRLSSFLAEDKFLPTQLARVGERLAYSNGIIALAAFAAVLLVLFDASVERLIPLYAIGVFTSFTFSQAGMVVHHLREREAGFRRGLVINAVGGTATFVVLIVVSVTKFMHGAWVIIVAIPFLVAVLLKINRHYAEVGRVLRDPARRPSGAALPGPVIIAVDRPGPDDRYATAYARDTKPSRIEMVHVGWSDNQEELVRAWGEVGISESLLILPRTASLTADLGRYIREVRAQVPSGALVHVVIPEVVQEHSTRQLLRRPEVQLLKGVLLGEPGVVVSNVTWHERYEDPHPQAARSHVAVVLVSAVHNATLQALKHAQAMRPDELHCLHVEMDPAQSVKTVREWESWSPGIGLEIVESPLRRLAEPVVDYLHTLLDRPEPVIVSLVLPEFIVEKWWHNLLHNQTALILKRALLFEPSVVVSSVPYRLGSKR